MGDNEKKKVLFICVHNSARSQIAEVYLREFGDDLFEVESAGLEPGRLNPYVVEVLKEDGIDITDKKTKSAWELFRAGKRYDYVITVCSREAEEKCPVWPQPTERRSWSYPDPSKFTGTEEEITVKVRELRNIMKEQVKQFIESYRNNERG